MQHHRWYPFPSSNLSVYQFKKTQQSARSADKSSLAIKGEARFTLHFGRMDLPITALVLEKLDCNILAGIPFRKTNDIHIHLKSESISIRDCTVPYGSSDCAKKTIQDI